MSFGYIMLVRRNFGLATKQITQKRCKAVIARDKLLILVQGKKKRLILDDDNVQNHRSAAHGGRHR